jgi:hypothetical protein
MAHVLFSRRFKEDPEMPFNTLFDAYVFVDWSAVSKPKFGADSIWIGAGEYAENGDLIVDQPANPATRRQAEAKVCELLVRHVQSTRRVLVGFDFPYGYPANWNNALGRNPGNWDALWSLLAERITDNNQNLNNRCEVANSLNAAVAGSPGPFWSRPNRNITLHTSLPAKKPHCFGDEIREFREVERQLRASGRQPKSVWQLFGHGSVGSQALVGVPVLHRLRNHESLRECSRVWPFETGWQCPSSHGPLVVHAEIWPGAIAVDATLHPVKDAAQMLSYVHWAASRDQSGNLAARFNPHAAAPAVYVHECEGWILSD